MDNTTIHYLAGLTITTLSSFVALWVNDTFQFGGELPDEETVETLNATH